MLKKWLISLVVVVSCVGAQNLNYNGWADTGTFVTFRADSLKYSAVYSLSGFENFRIDMMADDTGSAGFGSDSVKLQWGIQTGRPEINRNGKLDTGWSQRLVVDTLGKDSVGLFRMGQLMVLGADGSFSFNFRSIDTVSLTKYILQSRAFAPEWDVLVRVWAKGLTGNKVGGWVKAHYAVYRRVASGVRVK